MLQCFHRENATILYFTADVEQKSRFFKSSHSFASALSSCIKSMHAFMIISFLMLNTMILQYCFNSLIYLQVSLSLLSYSSESFEHLNDNKDLVSLCDNSASSYDSETSFRKCERKSEMIAILRDNDLQFIQLLERFRFFRDEKLRELLKA